MRLDIPAVAFSVGANAAIIRNGENGVLASSEDDWVRVLRFLLDDPCLRQQIGRVGRQEVESKYSFASLVDRWEQLLRGEA